MFVIEGAVFTVDGDGRVGGQVVVGYFGDGAGVFHVGGVDACAEDAADFHLRVSVGGSNEGAGCIVD